MAITIACILLYGVIVAVESAFASLNHGRVKRKAEEGDKKSISVKKIIDAPETYFATIQMLLTLFVIFIGGFTAAIFSPGIMKSMENSGVYLHMGTIVLLVTIVVSYFVIVFGELVPKNFGAKNAEAITYASVNILVIISKIAAPFVRILSFSAGFFIGLIRINKKTLDEHYTEDEIRMMVDVGGETGSIDETEIEMINNIFEFDDKTAEDISVHRRDIMALPIDAGQDDIRQVISNKKYTRIPVYQESIDDIVGVLHVKDLMEFVLDHKTAEEFYLKDILLEPYFVPTSKKADELFKEMKRDKVHMAIVVDEYGGTAGIVTMEDLIEEIMGNIYDEYDDEEIPDIKEIDENTYMVNGGTDLDTARDFFGIDLPVNEYDTLGGFLVSQLGYIPDDDEKPEIEFNGLLFKVSTVEDKRITNVIVCKV